MSSAVAWPTAPGQVMSDRQAFNSLPLAADVGEGLQGSVGCKPASLLRQQGRPTPTTLVPLDVRVCCQEEASILAFQSCSRGLDTDSVELECPGVSWSELEQLRSRCRTQPRTVASLAWMPLAACPSNQLWYWLRCYYACPEDLSLWVRGNVCKQREDAILLLFRAHLAAASLALHLPPLSAIKAECQTSGMTLSCAGVPSHD